ncbi:hypothetical protein TRFO_24563 [Tritrichomonas foetus]|uniref:Uncharacterized protein n=1 Tax=Tritrichomonas foetus TaxID=1144522 RepID=A0A1J4K764_9EUKA|nr:hypothetical protein TRFO_24563 [Tritrichomonas foetus]|eukprot:OHT07305.1 hypothetical protein TRFO_24563 [Tritrichomonas foetus]
MWGNAHFNINNPPAENEKKQYFKDNNKEIIEAIVKDDVDALSEIIEADGDSVNQEFGFDDQYLPRFLSSAPPIICVAAYFNAINIVQFLMSCGADLAKQDLLGRTVIHFAMTSCNLDIVRELDDGSIDFKTPDKNGNQPIHVACEFGFFDGVKYIHMKCGEDALLAMNNSLTIPLLVAAYNGHLEIIQFFKEIGLNILDCDSNGLNALHYACAGGQADVAKYLIENGMDVDRTGHDSDTPILYAAQNGNLETVKILVESGSKKYKQKNAKRSCLVEAASFGHADVIRYLVSMGADIYTTNSSGNSILSVAIDNNQPEVIKYLIKVGLKPHRSDFQKMLTNSFHDGNLELFKMVWKMIGNLSQSEYDNFLNLICPPNYFSSSDEPKEYKCVRYMIKKGVVFSSSAITSFLLKSYTRFYCPKDVLESLKKMSPSSFKRRAIITSWGRFY